MTGRVARWAVGFMGHMTLVAVVLVTAAVIAAVANASGWFQFAAALVIGAGIGYLRRRLSAPSPEPEHREEGSPRPERRESPFPPVLPWVLLCAAAVIVIDRGVAYGWEAMVWLGVLTLLGGFVFIARALVLRRHEEERRLGQRW